MKNRIAARADTAARSLRNLSATSGSQAGDGAQADPTSRRVIVCGILLGIAITIFGLGQLRSPEFSPFDEQTHAGYAWSIAHGEIPSAGSFIPDPVLEELACLGQPFTALPPCGSAVVPSEYSFGGLQHNYWQPPLYYAVSGTLASGISALTDAVSFLDALRWLSIIWVSAGMMVLYHALRVYGIPWKAAFWAAAALPAFPLVQHVGTSASNDAPAALGGAVAVLILARALVREDTGLAFPIAATALLAATKTLNVLALLIAAGALIAIAAQRRRTGQADAGRLARVGLSVIISAAIVHVSWSLFQSGRGIPDWVSPVDGVADKPIVGLPFGEWLSTLFSGADLTNQIYMDPGVSGVVMTLWIAAVGLFITAAPWVAVVGLSGDITRQAVAGVAAVGLLTFPTIVQLQVFLDTGRSGFYPFVTTRYGLSLVPVIFAAWALVADRFRLAWTTVLVSVTGILAVVVSST